MYISYRGLSIRENLTTGPPRCGLPGGPNVYFEIRVSTESRPWRRKFSRSCRDLNPGPFSHESGALTTELSWCLCSLANIDGVCELVSTVYGCRLQSNSKHWFTTSFPSCLLEGAGKRGVECGLQSHSEHRFPAPASWRKYVVNHCLEFGLQCVQPGRPPNWFIPLPAPIELHGDIGRPFFFLVLFHLCNVTSYDVLLNFQYFSARSHARTHAHTHTPTTLSLLVSLSPSLSLLCLFLFLFFILRTGETK